MMRTNVHILKGFKGPEQAHRFACDVNRTRIFGPFVKASTAGTATVMMVEKVSDFSKAAILEIDTVLRGWMLRESCGSC